MVARTGSWECRKFNSGFCYFTLLSQFFLAALWVGWGSGSWALRIPSWGALAAVSWCNFVFVRNPFRRQTTAFRLVATIEPTRRLGRPGDVVTVMRLL